MTALLEVDHLDIDVRSAAGERAITRDVSLRIAAGESLGLVGESGSGKSVTARAVMRLLPSTFRVSGDICFDGTAVPAMSRRRLQQYRSSDVAMVFQDPRAHINPVRTIGAFLTETADGGPRRGEGATAAVALLDELGVSDADRRMRQYPHELSGGMLQRVMIAAALAGRPRLLVADEPTTALDVTTQSDIMAQLATLRRERELAMLFITHDLELAVATCDRIAVMYAGRVVELTRAAALESAPRHPYSAALLASRPDIERRLPRLAAIPGRPIAAQEAPPGCSFAPRCPMAEQRCGEELPLARPVGESLVACHRAEEVHAAGPVVPEPDGGGAAAVGAGPA